VSGRVALKLLVARRDTKLLIETENLHISSVCLKIEIATVYCRYETLKRVKCDISNIGLYS